MILLRRRSYTYLINTEIHEKTIPHQLLPELSLAHKEPSVEGKVGIYHTNLYIYNFNPHSSSH